MAISTTSTIDDALPVFKNAMRATLKQTGVTRKRMDNVVLAKGAGLNYNEPQLSTFSVIGLTQGVDLSQAQTVSDTNVQITVAEAGGQVVITDLAVEALKDNILEMIGQGLGNAYSNRLDNDLTSLFSGLDAGFGTSSSTFAAGWLRAAHARLINATRPTSGPLSIVLHPYQWDDIALDMASMRSGTWRYTVGTPSVADVPGASISGATEEVWRKYFVSDLFGVPVFVDPTISITSSASYGAIFARDSEIYVSYREPDTENERDASLRATEINIVGVYGKGERDGTWGFYTQSDTTAPTS